MTETLVTEERPAPRAFLSTMSAGPNEGRLALVVVALSAICFAAMAPFAKTPLAPVPAFIPIYESALVINDLVTALLLFGQFAQLRSRGLLLLGCGYLFDALMIVPHALTFPGLFAPTGLLGAGPQSTAWIYMFWHGGFPILVMLYAAGASSGAQEAPGATRSGKASGVALVIAAVIAVACGLTWLATGGHESLPSIMEANGYTPAMKFVVTSVWMLSLAALVVVWRKRPRSVLDLWLMVVMFVWFCDIGLSSVLNAGRYDLGFYAGRIYGLLAASFVLALLLLETSGLYSRLARAQAQLEDRAHRLEGNVRDHIAMRQQTEAQLHQAQKMEAIGQLTGGLAHDFNNLLGIIIGNLDLLQQYLEGNAEAEELLRDAVDAAVRGGELTRRLLAFARRQPLRPERLDLNELVSGIVRLLARMLGENIEINLNLDPKCWPVTVDPAQLEASLTNLATNARDAMPRGGQIAVTTGNRQLDADYAALHPEVVPGEYAMIEVSDTGVGMPPEVLARAFEPFFTTKEQGKGTGLGLSMVFGFMKQSGGHINAYSEPGHGTTFRLYLPRTLIPETQRRLRATEQPQATGGHETILVTEDNAGMRRIAVRQLTELGYRVLEAETADAALAILERERADLLFTDIVMPGQITGVELTRIVLDRWPEMRVVLTSGFPDAKLNGSLGAAMSSARLLTKPYRKEELARALREVLGR